MPHPDTPPANDVTPENVAFLALVAKVGAAAAGELEDEVFVCRACARAA